MHSSSSSAPSKPTRLRQLTSIAACVTFAASLPGCGATLPTCQTESPPQRSLPSVSTPAPAQPYSKSWQTEVDAWQSAVQNSRDKLMATPLMSSSSKAPAVANN